MSVKSDIIDSLVNEDMASLYGKFSNSLISNAISKSVDDALQSLSNGKIKGIPIKFQNKDADMGDVLGLSGTKVSFSDKNTIPMYNGHNNRKYFIKDKILSFNDGIKKCMDDMLPPILTEIYTIFIKNNIDTKGLTCDVVIDGELCAEAVEIVLNCNIDMNKLKGNKDDIYSCIEYAHELLDEDKKKYGISRVTNKDVYSISFEIAF